MAEGLCVKKIMKKIASVALVTLVAVSGVTVASSAAQAEPAPVSVEAPSTYQKALDALNTLAVKGRAPKTGYARSQFGAEVSASDYDGNGCKTRDDILRRDLTGVKLRADGCTVTHGTLRDPYTGKTIKFIRTGKPGGYSNAVQIDHVVALSDAWQKGAQQWSKASRTAFAHDPANLLAVDGPANAQKGDGDAATWLPSNKSYRCTYVSKQVTVKVKYGLWVTAAEKTAIANLLTGCGAGQATYSGPFIDVPDNHKFAKEIAWMHSSGLSTGVSTSAGPAYRPNDRLTREAMAAFMFRKFGESSYQAPAVSPFIDVRPGHKFYREIVWMYDSGLSTGVRVGDAREYRPSDRLSREAMAAFMYRSSGPKMYKPARNSPFIDVSPNHKFYKEIAWMYTARLSTGVSTSGGREYRPSDRLTREAMAAFMYRDRGSKQTIAASPAPTQVEEPAPLTGAPETEAESTEPAQPDHDHDGTAETATDSDTPDPAEHEGADQTPEPSGKPAEDGEPGSAAS
jgi:hypothetical protein